MLIRDFVVLEESKHFSLIEFVDAVMLLGKYRSKQKNKDFTFFITNEKFLPRYNTIVGNWGKFSEVIKVENPEYLREGDIFEVTRTRESLYIRKIEKDSIYVSREYGYKWETTRPPCQDIYNGDEIMVMSSSLESVQES